MIRRPTRQFSAVAVSRKFGPLPLWAWILGGLGAVALLVSKGVDLKNKIQWVRYVFDEVTSVLPTLSVKARMLIVAHAAFESGYGQLSSAMKKGSNNLFNLTAGSSWLGPTVAGGDSNAAGQPITQQWRVYPTYRASILDYWNFLGPNQNRGRYVAARNALQLGDVTQFAQQLYLAGYYELSPTLYASRLDGTFSAVSKLLTVTA